MVLDPTKRAKLEPGRMASTRKKLLALGCKVVGGPDSNSFKVTFPAGRVYNFWPYSGWYAGPSQGRGFKIFLMYGPLPPPKKREQYKAFPHLPLSHRHPHECTCGSQWTCRGPDCANTKPKQCFECWNKRNA